MKLYDNNKSGGIWKVIGRDYFYPRQPMNESSSWDIAKGVYKYIFGLLFLYIPGLFGLARNSLWLAFCFHFGAILNYYFSELPDKRYMTYIHSEINNDNDINV